MGVEMENREERRKKSFQILTEKMREGPLERYLVSASVQAN